LEQNYFVGKNNFVEIKIKICSFGSKLTLKNEKNIQLEQIVPLEQNREKDISLEL